MLRMLSAATGQHFSGLNKAVFATRHQLPSATRRRLQHIAITQQFHRHFTEVWEDEFCRELDRQLSVSFPRYTGGHAVVAPRFGMSRATRTSRLRREAPEFNPHAAPMAVCSSVPALLAESQQVYDSQMAAYQSLVNDQNETIAKLRSCLEREASQFAGSSSSSASSVSDSVPTHPAHADSISPGAVREQFEFGAEGVAHAVSELQRLYAELPAKIDGRITGAVREVYKSLPTVINEAVQQVVVQSIDSVLSAGMDEKIIKVRDVVEASEQRVGGMFSARLEQLNGQFADLDSELCKLASRMEDHQDEHQDLAARVDALVAARAGPKGNADGSRAASASSSCAPRSPSVLTVCKYGHACFRRDCSFHHPGGRKIDGGGPVRISPLASPINYSKFDDIILEDTVCYIIDGMSRLDPALDHPPEPDID